ncbi:hypothetical protein IWQ60_002828 [Tieghemiomyces parasiticus]|uniref:Uncharacterized protein n=1 Tax=Tieghemiomyces parasiticus TaxID=78921 RepID=A0A9W8ABJ7_9FUNG|nr:hypothetical protein IWQ60_002828 [Tieghemiomyces parasiticus]
MPADSLRGVASELAWRETSFGRASAYRSAPWHRLTGRPQGPVLRHYLGLFAHTSEQVYRFPLASETGAPLFACQFNPQPALAHFCLTASEGGLLLLADTRPGQLTTGRPTTEDLPQSYSGWMAHANAIFDVQWHADGRRALSAAGDQTIKLWDVETHQCTARFPAHEGSVKACAWNPTEPNVFASAGRDGRVVIWDLRCASRPEPGEDTALVRVYRPSDVIQNAHSVLDSLAGSGTGTSGLVGTGSITEVTKRKRPSTPTSSPARNRVRSIMPGSPSAGRSPTRRLAKPRAGVGPGQSATSVLYIPHSPFCLASAGVLNGTVKYWDTRRLGRHMGQAHPQPTMACPALRDYQPTRGLASLAATPDGSRLFALSLDNSIHMYDSQNLQRYLGALTGPNFKCASVYLKMSISPDSNYLASGSTTGDIYVWSLHQPLSLAPVVLQSHRREVSAVSWSQARANTLASCSDDCSLRVWEINWVRAAKIRSLRSASRCSAAQQGCGALDDDDFGCAA